MLERFLVPVYLPRWLFYGLRSAKRVLLPPSPALVNTQGERFIEWTFLSVEMPPGPGEAIEFGCEQGYLSLLAAQKGYRVLSVDLEEQAFLWRHERAEFRQADLLRLKLQQNYFDLAINCSSVEHVGLPGRYGINQEDGDGDLAVMRRLADILKPGGLLLMTVPCGRDVVMGHLCRVYGAERLPRLLAPFHVEKEVYWVKDEANRWVLSARERALDFAALQHGTNPPACSYALGGFVLRKRVGASQGKADGDGTNL